MAHGKRSGFEAWRAARQLRENDGFAEFIANEGMSGMLGSDGEEEAARIAGIAMERAAYDLADRLPPVSRTAPEIIQELAERAAKGSAPQAQAVVRTPAQPARQVGRPAAQTVARRGSRVAAIESSAAAPIRYPKIPTTAAPTMVIDMPSKLNAPTLAESNPVLALDALIKQCDIANQMVVGKQGKQQTLGSAIRNDVADAGGAQAFIQEQEKALAFYAQFKKPAVGAAASAVPGSSK